MSVDDGTIILTEEERKKREEEIKRLVEEEKERRRKEAEERRKKEEAEKRLLRQEQERSEQMKRAILMEGFTEEHKKLYAELEALERSSGPYDKEEVEAKKKVLIQKLCSIPLNFGTFHFKKVTYLETFDGTARCLENASGIIWNGIPYTFIRDSNGRIVKMRRTYKNMVTGWEMIGEFDVSY